MDKSIQNCLYYDQLITVNLTFAALLIKNTQHRRILNRQLVTKYVAGFVGFCIDWKVMSN
jgi:hypothetical protein